MPSSLPLVQPVLQRGGMNSLMLAWHLPIISLPVPSTGQPPLVRCQQLVGQPQQIRSHNRSAAHHSRQTRALTNLPTDVLPFPASSRPPALWHSGTSVQDDIFLPQPLKVGTIASQQSSGDMRQTREACGYFVTVR